jgi:5-methylcytosine-specific restriction protein A
MKLMNFRRLDPEYTSDGRAGLSRGSKGDETVWNEFASDPVQCHKIAGAILRTLDDQQHGDDSDVGRFDEFIEEAPEGRILTRIHLSRERNRRLLESKRRQALEKFGKLVCEVCGFDFSMQYGVRGQGFIECHHTKPVITLCEGQRSRPWLSHRTTQNAGEPERCQLAFHRHNSPLISRTRRVWQVAVLRYRISAFFVA